MAEDEQRRKERDTLLKGLKDQQKEESRFFMHEKVISKVLYTRTNVFSTRQLLTSAIESVERMSGINLMASNCMDIKCTEHGAKEHFESSRHATSSTYPETPRWFEFPGRNFYAGVAEQKRAVKAIQKVPHFNTWSSNCEEYKGSFVREVIKTKPWWAADILDEVAGRSTAAIRQHLHSSFFRIFRIFFGTCFSTYG